MTKPRTQNPAFRIEIYDDANQLFVGVRLDTAQRCAMRLTDDSPSPRRPSYMTFRKGLGDHKMKTPVGGIVQFDTVRPRTADGQEARLDDGSPVYEAKWATLLAKDPEENPVVAALPVRMIELKVKGAGGELISRADVIDVRAAVASDGTDAPGFDPDRLLETLCAARTFPGPIEDRNRHFVVRSSKDRGDPTTTIVGLEQIADVLKRRDEAKLLPSKAWFVVTPMTQIFVGPLAKRNMRRMAPFANHPETSFMRCNLVLGHHRMDGDGNEIPDDKAQRFLTACTFSEFPEPASLQTVDLGEAKAPDAAEPSTQ